MAVKKIKWIQTYNALKSDPHLVSTSPFAFVTVVIMLGDERKDNFLYNNLFLSKPPGLRAFSHENRVHSKMKDLDYVRRTLYLSLQLNTKKEKPHINPLNSPS